MADPEQPSRRDAADLAAYVDGRLEGARLARFEARVAAEPSLAAAVELQGVALRAIDLAVAETVAPAGLRQRVDAERRAHAGNGRPTTNRRFGRLRPAGLGAGLAAAAAAVVVALVFLGGGGLTVEDAAALAAKPPTEAVTQDPRTPQLLREDVEGVRFPDYAAKFGWRAVGERSDVVDGRDVRTVFYEKDGKRIAYSIVAGDPLDRPDGDRVSREGVAFTVFYDDGVTWERQGHTCVLTGADADTLAELGAWKGKGAVQF